MEAFLDFLATKGPRPEIFSWFHLLWTGIIIAAIALTVIFLRYVSEKRNRWFLFGLTMTMIVCEVLKLVITTHVNNGFRWMFFPFQFCSTPMYVGLLAAFLPDCKVRRALYSFLATYGLFGGLAILLYPLQVFDTDYVFLQNQTMIHHGIIALIGIYLIASGRVKFNKELVIGSVIVFLSLNAIAEGFNTIAYWAGIANDPTQLNQFNMFYISPFQTTGLPGLAELQKVSFTLFLIAYLIVFTLLAYMMFFIAYGFKNIKRLLRKNN